MTRCVLLAVLVVLVLAVGVAYARPSAHPVSVTLDVIEQTGDAAVFVGEWRYRKDRTPDRVAIRLEADGVVLHEHERSPLAGNRKVYTESAGTVEGKTVTFSVRTLSNGKWTQWSHASVDVPVL